MVCKVSNMAKPEYYCPSKVSDIYMAISQGFKDGYTLGKFRINSGIQGLNYGHFKVSNMVALQSLQR